MRGTSIIWVWCGSVCFAKQSESESAAVAASLTHRGALFSRQHVLGLLEAMAKDNVGKNQVMTKSKIN